MFVNAPRRTTEGTTTVLSAFKACVPFPPTNGYLTAEQAIANAYLFNESLSRMTGSTTRQSMLNGVIGWKKYETTPYGASYKSMRWSGHATSILRYIDGKYYAQSLPIRFGDTGFHQTGVGGLDDPLDILNPSGGSLLPAAIYNRAVVSNLQKRAEVEAKLKFSNSGLDYGEALASIDKQLLSIAELTTRVVYAWRSVRKGNFRLAAKHLGITRANLNFKSASEAWLAFEYGWRPLLQDIHREAELGLDLLKGRPDIVRVTRRVAEELLAPKPAAGPYWEQYTCQSKAECTVEVKLWARPSNQYLAYLSSINLVNPLYIAWAAMPYSFVIDWLLPIGDWLSSVTSPLGLQFTGGYKTVRVFGQVAAAAEKHKVLQPALYGHTRSFGYTSVAAESLWMSRTKYNTWPLSQLYVKFPFKSYERVANAVALIQTSGSLRWRR